MHFRGIYLPTGYRITSLEFTAKGAVIQGFPQVPHDWVLNLALDGSRSITVKTGAQHGTAWLSSFRELDHFIVLNADDFENVEVGGTIYLSSNGDEPEKAVTITSKNVSFDELNDSLQPTNR